LVTYQEVRVTLVLGVFTVKIVYCDWEMTMVEWGSKHDHFACI
jgi:hypothetical protein